MNNTNRMFMALNLFLAILLVSSFSQPVSAQSSSVISACVNKSSGALRISTKCTKLENPISWNKTGTPGPRGSDAFVYTKLVTISYIGDGSKLFSPCGDGTETISSMLGNRAKTFKGYFLGLRESDVGSLTSNANWAGNPYCSITLKVVE